MNCPNARDCLLHADRPGDGPADLVAHVRACPNCQKLAGLLDKFERHYRDEMQAVRADAARDAFLTRLPVPPPPSRLRLRLVRCALAAVLLLAVGAGLWALLAPGSGSPDDLVERLIDWNLDLNQAQAADNRTRIFSERGPELEQALRQANLSEEDRHFAVALLHSGTWLAANNDPTAAADRFNDLADHLLEQIDNATTKKDARRLRQVAAFYRRIAEQGILANLDRAEESGALDFQHQRKLERVIIRDAERAKKLAELLDRAPNASRKEIRRALDLGKPPRAKKPRKR